MVAIEQRMAKAFGLEGDSWQRHANPWSVYTRILYDDMTSDAPREAARR